MSEADLPLDPDVVAKEIGLPTSEWPGQCHAVAEAFLRHLPTWGMRLVRGHFNGGISRNSVYRSAGVQQHSWLRLGDGRILDPTRWAMQRPDRPFIYLGANDHYDEAGIELSLRAQAAWRGSIASIGRESGQTLAIRRALERAPNEARAALLRVSGAQDRAGEPLSARTIDRIETLLTSPVEHLEAPEGLYAAAERTGLKAMIRHDCWVRVMEPESVAPAAGRNFFYQPPAAPARSEMEKLFLVFARFLSIEAREATLERELEEYGYSIDELHGALNRMERVLSIDPDLGWLPSEHRDLLCVVGSDLLGKGFGAELRVERFADSIGLDRAGLHCAIKAFSVPAGFDFTWLTGPEARRAEESRNAARESCEIATSQP